MSPSLGIALDCNGTPPNDKPTDLPQTCSMKSFLEHSEKCATWAKLFFNGTGSGSVTRFYDYICEPCGRLYTEFLGTFCGAGYDDLATFYALHCGRNASKVRCDVVEKEAMSTTSNSPVIAALVACNASLNPTVACTPECASLLENIRHDYGCCINNLLNNTYFRHRLPNSIRLVSYDLWSRCNVVTPEFCPTESDEVPMFPPTESDEVPTFILTEVTTLPPTESDEATNIPPHRI